MTYTNINGKLTDATTAAIHPDNSAFRYGVGLFETMLVTNGAIRLLQYHMDRLFAGLMQLHFEVPALFTPAFLEAEVLKTVARNKLQHRCRVRLQVYTGSGGIFGPDSDRPRYVIECYSMDNIPTTLNENGLVAGIATGIQKSTDSLSNLKTANALLYAMAARQARHNKWNDALVCNTHGNITESCIANIFWVSNGTVYTPPLSEGCVAGVMRRHLLHTHTTIVEKPLTPALLATADEVFLTNAIRGIRWIGTIGHTTYTCSHTKSLADSTLFP